MVIDVGSLPRTWLKFLLSKGGEERKLCRKRWGEFRWRNRRDIFFLEIMKAGSSYFRCSPICTWIRVKKAQGDACNYCCRPGNLSQSEEPESIFKAEQITMRYIQATVMGLHAFGLHIPQLSASKLCGHFVNLAIIWPGIFFLKGTVGLTPLFGRILCYFTPAICQALFYVLQIPTGELASPKPFLLLLSLVEKESASLPLIFFPVFPIEKNKNIYSLSQLILSEF